eukprot:gnl/Spiro4/4204_TR2100_c0_g1_i1.p1 gnl/Spiro4/4204_TR2100_c0_g1~~gnl/Spiro4/4204_TR2100_c0_g1_i1.p1  ORF type:complete len:381 (+),score=60.54 gnl/Spiro4/4204_TR2100_c0_g1_i1:50-1144(+)
MFLPSFISIQNVLLGLWWVVLYFLWSFLDFSVMYFLVFGFGGIIPMRALADELIRKKELYEAQYSTQVRPAVLVTGAARGMGRSITMALSEAGYHVFAGVRQLRDLESFKGLSPNISTLTLDVASQESVTNGIRELTTRLASASPPMRLVAVVNNAGILCTAPHELATPEEFNQVIQVNLLGVYRVSVGCLPLLREAAAEIRGSGGGPSPRIILISSVSGILAFPYAAGYSASKFGAQALADSLRMELGMTKQGIDVVVVQPGAVTTDMSNQVVEHGDDFISKLKAAGPLSFYMPPGEHMVVSLKRLSKLTTLEPSAAGDLIKFILKVRSADLRTHYVLTPCGFIYPLLQSLIPTRLMDSLAKI